ncbi:MAG TPA: hypothetical protein VMJ35_08970 [Dongiaceae bacterium]|nr:hypothetical protein [Dongiaceae bacterium]
MRGPVALLAILAAPGVAWAQNCALCYTQAASAGSRMIAALRSGILILVLPPMLICLGITWMAYKKRNQFNEDHEEGLLEERSQENISN